MHYLLINTHIRRETFLRNQFHIEHYHELILGSQTYGKLFEEGLSCFAQYQKHFCHFESLTADRILQFLEKSGIELQKDDQVVLYDLSCFPLDCDALNLLFQKCSFSQKWIRFFVNGETAPLLCFSQTHLLDAFSQKPDQNLRLFSPTDELRVDATGLVCNIEDSHALLELFSHNFQVRHFNAIQNKHDGFFLKSSSNKQKMAEEYAFFQEIPNRLKPYFPQVGAFWEEEGMASYEVEQIYLLDASKLLLNRIFAKPEKLQGFTEKLLRYLQALPTKTVDNATYAKALKKLTLDKNLERLEQTRQLPFYEALNRIAQTEGFETIDVVFSAINKAIEPHLEGHDTLAFSHGDLCFSNILYDPDTGQLKLIDPKGIHAEIDYFRPLIYDIAKLSHSFIGLYDLMVYDRVQIQLVEPNRFELGFNITPIERQALKQAFVDLLQHLPFDLATVRLFEASLFISMIPLHKDNPKRICAQLIHAIQTYKETVH
ncbi:MAG: hypothetical protein A2Y14_03440 [Verrucomicrobia bacterium GWF2_51_19]|nr:MAG: hypothetical protein A2Y14_03440 [Verrucomicrobia bacterium GWF2_51_19]HCJ11486.1 hypothetical protein [Opitutae bacterium]